MSGTLPMTLIVLLALQAAPGAGSAPAPCRDLSSWEQYLNRGISRQGRDDEEALSDFTCAYELGRKPVALMQKALAEKATDRWGDAERDLTETLNHAKDPAIRPYARVLRDQLAEVTAYLDQPNLSIEGTPAGAAVSIDGKPAGTLPLSLRVRPGTVHIDVTAPGYIPVHRDLDLPKRAAHTETIELTAVALPMPALVTSTVPASPPSPPPGHSALTPQREDGPSLFERPATWFAGVGILALGSGVAFHVARENRARDFNRDNNGCGEKIPNYGAPGCDDKHDRVESAQTLAIVSYTAAGVLGVFSTVLFLTSPSKKRQATATLECGPRIGGAGVLCISHF